ncbi:hypothetical protein HanRHA438_Chr07g0294811 [Helianthus annuus]|uniref:Uncharacterized protein n=1 Tax=Helianthus annuus TaxID=4232 RepID=A0A9K3IJJ8_HELAN|nr:hypothetical protein HanXRQr2_Chr07g0284331 [Helianthus annuus]KAJ0549435.1 hypothetical protein HanHA300_Chr07g0233651 [Helianthus annuus]KAJ0555802.1 hypothetical protein HanIR_Chr07g0306331 [Helianthus annuus]KAJ0562390.1 hypothetical protein HanHA89_Chr07g0250821 [Helianthus annuus]KAJ0727765.1 hypothetical protein HanLR1_Chr07g0233581 [Helianthus annuus]
MSLNTPKPFTAFSLQLLRIPKFFHISMDFLIQATYIDFTSASSSSASSFSSIYFGFSLFIHLEICNWKMGIGLSIFDFKRIWNYPQTEYGIKPSEVY